MKTTMKITLRAFPVKIQDTRTGKTTEDKIILTKEQLHAADLVGQSSKELEERLAERIEAYAERGTTNAFISDVMRIRGCSREEVLQRYPELSS